MTASLQRSLRIASRVQYLTVRAFLALLIAVESGPRVDSGLLVRQLKIPAPAVSRAVEALCINGFVKRVRNEDDHRKVFVVVLQKGRSFVDSLSGAA